MEVKLVVVGGSNSGREIHISGPKFLIGRSEDCQLRPKSDQVSRHHAVVLLDEGFAAIRDFGSKNGTFVNGERVTAEHELKNGDRLRIGPLEFDVQLSVAVGGKKKPKIHSVKQAAARTVEAAADDDLDIGDWLAEDEESDSATGSHDTLPLSSAATASTSLGDMAAESEENAKNKEKEKEKEKKKAGRFQGAKRPSSVDTQSAADDTLRKLFERRM